MARPVKVALLVDTSQSMSASDPGKQRYKAAEQLVNKWLSTQPQVRFLIIGFNSGVTVNGASAPASAEFTNSFAKLTKALKTLSTASGATDIHGAVATASKVVQADLATTAALDRALSRYQIVLLAYLDQGRHVSVCRSRIPVSVRIPVFLMSLVVNSQQ